MVADIDKDGSGTIDFEEFLQMMTAKMGERDSREEIMKAFSGAFLSSKGMHAKRAVNWSFNHRSKKSLPLPPRSLLVLEP